MIRRLSSGALFAWALLIALALALPESAGACAVCYGGADDAMTQGMNNGILTLLGVVGVVQVGFVALFWSFWRRTRELKMRRKKFHLVDGGTK